VDYMLKSAIKPELLKILACPENHQQLRLLDDAELSSLNIQISGGNISDHQGHKINQAWEGGLIREDGKRAYPIESGLPILLIDSSIDL
jgi:uncharacterized protein YbaR (Trm112 family)